ncbi:GNAT family N-acetyltransferase [Echinimonas agarilytica]|uniref:GNAT family N-acetyltransferase n=1 Tax=Echinimonas agarilytica TaxID=1215918 RepID=A0AA41W8P3_9GAMM|nr:GNAT family N-acetyltransferase [Echinimonas agarilytica]MCM2681105.1 GNAT family N-acetyltransferase [Echinimonas agarilytica]
MNFKVKPITAAQTILLRHQILRPHRHVSTAYFDGDDSTDSLHLGAYSGDELACVASFMKAQCPGFPTLGAHYQLRGMATATEWQRRGAGTALLQYMPTYLREFDAELVWCNSRINAISFYLKIGFTQSSEPFDIVDVGQHVQMIRSLS